MDVIQASIPFFFLLIGVELLVARLRRRPLYRLSDSISDLSCGILSQLAGIFIVLLTIAGYGWVQSHWGLQHALPVSAWIAGAPAAAWLLVFTLDDLAYYWMHRYSHVVNLLWAGHVVHHSSEEFNLTVALRQSSLHGLMSWLFYLPIALLGVPRTMWLTCHALNLVYQFWIHTREIKTLGPLEWVLNTPSHHRVHHGINPEYQDRNFAGTFIIWDRLFGTFEPERAPVVYGITKPLATWNPLRANVHQFQEIWRNARAARTLRDKLRAVFGHPGWRPPELGPPVVPGPVSPETFAKYEPPVSGALRRYALVQFVVVLAGSLVLLQSVPRLPIGETMAGMFYVTVSLGGIGGVLESRSWAGVSEAVRLAVLGGAALVLLATGAGPAWLLGFAATLAAGSLVWVLRLRPLLVSRDVRAVVAM
ncbi:MAG TPA: sterol desaturase family protein [Gemmatimonadales bacterium]|jgi:sterol desaturase/sphingolipid hydroxylase (fatty acid hydroxylase superfamily)|nr:sterol desaturase family protein [Gemmatimonadales bacterium]